MRLAIFVESPLRRAHGNDVVEAVASLNAHVVRYRPQSMRWIKIAVALGVKGAAPQAFALVRKQLVAKIVDVRAFAVEQIAEKPFMNHAQNERFVIAIAAVLKHDAVPPGLLGRVDELPAIFDGRGGWNLYRGMFPVRHC